MKPLRTAVKFATAVICTDVDKKLQILVYRDSVQLKVEDFHLLQVICIWLVCR